MELVGQLHEIPSADLDAISEVFPDCNVMNHEVLGSKKAEEMAISWIIAPGIQIQCFRIVQRDCMMRARNVRSKTGIYWTPCGGWFL